MNCTSSLTNQKQWTIYQLNKITGQISKQIFIENNPTINYAELVLQPQTLSYGLYKVVYSVIMTSTNLTSSAETFFQIIPSGLVLSSLNSKQPIYGGTIQITRGSNQQIQFNPYLFTYDIDNVAVITSLSFKYACQVLISNVPQGYPQMPGTNQTIYLDDLKFNLSLGHLNTCFNSKGKILTTIKYKSEF